ncbi:MAG: 50S ribosomal protein L10 [Acidobacteria bacterium]|nr:50S ribosomal protein L10 [Acidobacteriota bacterium]MCG2816538.1 50S ribosomal protein L10 [Candidatus Aminicenantes bacterium]MBU1337935.1 50S ribosomal protein L10 [Acidobacteriota bacterium]MBU1475698.1 50S ribosomal protein L10 [Acidobacteriota bacterium]MBU2439036.1 50S ribosomal protein L10 [Acidobacteriota bacterium]
MSVNREKKEQKVKDLQHALSECSSFYLINFTGMPVNRATELRKQLKDHSYSLEVIKNRLALRSLKADYPEELQEHFKGPTALAFAKEDPVGLAKIIKEFSAQHKMLVVKAALLDGQYFPGERFDEIAQLVSREELLAKLGYMMSYPLTQFLRAMRASLSGFGNLLAQLKDQKEQS